MVEVGDRAFQAADGPGCARLGLFEPLHDARDHAVDHHLRRPEIGLVEPADPFAQPAEVLGESAQLLADVDQRLARLGLGIVEVGGDLAERGLERPQGLHRARLGGELLDLGDPLFAPGLGGLDLIERALEPRGDRHLIALGGLQPGQQAQHRLVDTADGQGRTVLGGLHAHAEPVQGLAKTGEFLGGDGPRRCLTLGVKLGLVRGRGRVGLVRRVFQDDAVQPVAERESFPASEILGDLARFGVDPLNAPRRPRTHSESFSTRTQNANHPCLVCKRAVNTRYGVAALLLWTVGRELSASNPLPTQGWLTRSKRTPPSLASTRRSGHHPVP